MHISKEHSETKPPLGGEGLLTNLISSTTGAAREPGFGKLPCLWRVVSLNQDLLCRVTIMKSDGALVCLVSHSSNENGAEMCLFRGFDKVCDFSVANGCTAVRQSYHVTLISDVAEGVFVLSHDFVHTRQLGTNNLEVVSHCHK